ncbi:MAG: hypothetical protein M3535_03590 [Actinomycetota bacterium]|nr:hypothetical protein [Actinomycetota bacterium]
MERGRTWEHRFEGYWRDVGTLESYWRSHMDLLQADPLLRLDEPAWPILTTSATRAPARVERSASIDSSMVSPGCQIRGTVERSVLGPGVVVEQGAVVRSSVLLGDSVVEAGALVSGTIVDMRARVRRGAVVGLREVPEGGCHDDDLVVLGEGVQVPPDAVVGPGSRPTR